MLEVEQLIEDLDVGCRAAGEIVRVAADELAAAAGGDHCQTGGQTGAARSEQRAPRSRCGAPRRAHHQTVESRFSISSTGRV